MLVSEVGENGADAKEGGGGGDVWRRYVLVFTGEISWEELR